MSIMRRAAASLAVAAGLAGGPALAADAMAPCKALRADFLAKAKSPMTFVAGLRDPLPRLLAPRLQTRSTTATPPNEAEVRRVTGFQESVIAYDLVVPGVWRASVFGGTANCQSDAFLRVQRGGRLSQIPDAPAFSDLCWTSSREMGTVDGRPALIETSTLDRPVLGFDVAITPWNDGWLAACELSLRYTDAFRLDETFCGDKEVCAAAAPLATRLAAAFAHHPADQGLTAASLPRLRAAEAARLEPVRKALDDRFREETSALPSFGMKPRTEFPAYSDDLTAVAAELAGRPVVVRVGIGGVGWRPIGDYLVAVYDAQSRPLAGFVVSQQITGLASATVRPPRPFKSER